MLPLSYYFPLLSSFSIFFYDIYHQHIKIFIYLIYFLSSQLKHCYMKTCIILYASFMVESLAPWMKSDTQKLISAFIAHSSFLIEENLTNTSLQVGCPSQIPLVCSVVFNSLQPHGLQPTRVLFPQGFSKQVYWSGQPFPSPGDFPDPGIELMSILF